jgi:hypothetical protein
MKILFFFKKFYDFLKLQLKKNLSIENPLCRIEEIDTFKKTVLIHCQGIEAPIKFRFREIIFDIAILDNLSSLQASWIGYYYGKEYFHELHEDRRSQNFEFLQKQTGKRFEIILQDRKGNIVYQDKQNKTTFALTPLKIITHKNLISGFDALQACYIGLLVGIAASKPNLKKTKPLLRIAPLKLIKSP